MKKVLAVVAASLISSAAMAWGDREQGILTGIAGTLLAQHMGIQLPQAQPQYPQHYPPVYTGQQHYPLPQVIQQRPQIIYQQPQVIYQQQRPQIIYMTQPQPYRHPGHHGHHRQGEYGQLPDPRVYSPQIR